METVEFKGLRLSRLMLGTAQFGMRYGIANSKGQPSYAEVKSILSAAVDAGVNCLDTASAYGESEATIGKALHELGMEKRFFVVTKTAPLTTEELSSPSLAEKSIRCSVEKSLRLLRLESLPLVLFHREADFAYVETLEKLRGEGLVQHFGMSCETWSRSVLDKLSTGKVEALQLPASILDRRYLKMGAASAASKLKAPVFIRSVFLQGLLLMPEPSVPEGLKAVIPVRRRLAELAAEAEISISELALRYILSQEGVSCVAMGIDDACQLRENLALFERGNLSADILKRIEDEVPALPDEIVSPSRWRK